MNQQTKILKVLKLGKNKYAVYFDIPVYIQEKGKNYHWGTPRQTIEKDYTLYFNYNIRFVGEIVDRGNALFYGARRSQGRENIINFNHDIGEKIQSHFNVTEIIVDYPIGNAVGLEDDGYRGDDFIYEGKTYKIWKPNFIAMRWSKERIRDYKLKELTE